MSFSRLLTIFPFFASLLLHAQPTAPPSVGSDIGAWINATAAACVANTPCHIRIPPGQNYSYATTIVYVSGETIECSPAHYVTNSGTFNTPAQLTYTGTGTAVSMPRTAFRDSWVGCSLVVSNKSAATGFALNGIGFWIRDADIEGGGVASKLIHFGGISSRNFAGDFHVVNTNINNYVGPAMYADYVSGITIEHTSVVGVHGSFTGVGLTVDSEAQGITINDMNGGDSGLHNLVVQHSETGNYPENLFLHQITSDLAGGDGWLFAASLGTAPLHCIIESSWVSGSGGAGVRISGGSEITFTGNHIRANTGDGILIDGTGTAIVISGNQILGNNAAAGAGISGIRVTSHPSGLLITGNTIGNYPESGSQTYAFSASSDIDNVNFSFNNCSNNTISCQNTAAITASKLTSVGNTSESESNLMNRFPSPIETITAGVGGVYLMPFSGSNLPGLGGNLYFDGTNYRTSTDGGSNGAFGLLGSYANGSSCVYSIPTNTPKDPQTIGPSGLDRYCALSITPQLISAPAAINAAAGYKYNGTAGFTGTKKAGSCVLTIQGGIITNVTGC